MPSALRRLRSTVLVASSAIVLAGCFDPPPRNAVPPALVETAKVAGYGTIRYWGDEPTPAFDAAITKLFEQIKAAAKAGIDPEGVRKADFLAISGGGDNGAFTAGLVAGWTKRGNRPTFEAITGVSTGALAAPFVFLGPAYDDDLRDIYTKQTSADLFTDRGLLGLLGSSLKGTGPLERLIRHYATDAFLDLIGAQYHLGRRLLVATTDLDAQRPIVWDLTAIAASGLADRRELFVGILLASSAIPGVFPPVLIPDEASNGKSYTELHVDGGVTNELIFVPPEARLLHFEDQAFGMVRDRTLYVIRNGKLTPDFGASVPTVLDLAARGVSTLVKYQVLSNLRVLERAMDESKSHFVFTAIPTSFQVVAKTPFDLGYQTKLYRCGYEVGLHGTWLTTPADSPALEARPEAPDGSKSLGAVGPDDSLCAHPSSPN